MWESLEENWTHFFWLSGELPFTLNLLTDQISETLRRRPNGRQCRITLKNQVYHLRRF